MGLSPVAEPFLDLDMLQTEMAFGGEQPCFAGDGDVAAPTMIRPPPKAVTPLMQQSAERSLCRLRAL